MYTNKLGFRDELDPVEVPEDASIGAWAELPLCPPVVVPEPVPLPVPLELPDPVFAVSAGLVARRALWTIGPLALASCGT